MYSDPTGHFLWGLLAAFVLLCTPIGEILTQAVVTGLTYAGIAVASIFDEDIRNDMNAIGWNPFNSNPDMSKVNKVSFYKGEAVIIQDFAGSSFSFGIMGLHKNDKHDIKTVNHEWGHFAQLTLFGPATFILLFGIPSMLYNLYCQKTGDWSKYYKMPWEAFADYLGGVKR